MRTALFLLALGASAAPADDKVPAWYGKAVSKVEAAFEPATATPGQSVTLKVTVHLTDGYHTYPLTQADPNAEDMVNALKFPATPGQLEFVSDATVTSKVETKAEPVLGITAMEYLSGKVVYERKAVVAATAAAGPVEVAPELRLSVCDKNNCYPPRTVTPTATLTIVAGGS